MNLTSFALERGNLTNFLVFLIVVGGIFSFATLGRLEDPDFTVKVGVIVTQYPGASPEEVELEVTDRIERAIQEMPQLDTLYSFSRPGLSIVKVDIRPEFSSALLPQVWDEVRKKVRDVTSQFPPGVQKPDIMDDFSFVFGFVLAVTGDGFSYAEIEEYAKEIKKELSLVQGVSRVDIWGAQPKVIYLDLPETQLAALRISREDVLATLALQNMVVSAGAIEVSGQRLRVETTGQFQSPEDIGELVIRRSSADTMRPAGQARSGSAARAADAELIRISDVATVREGYLEPAMTQMRFQGKPALAIQLANVAGGNIIDTGAALDKRLEEIKQLLPAGIEVEKFTWQSDLVAESINGFMINLAEAVLIVLAVLAVAMGWRMGLVIGWALIVTILGTFVVMKITAIDLQRVSLGALVVALGMMVDNAIVVADNYSVRLAKGMQPKDAAIDSAASPSITLLLATIVAAMAFYPIYVAKSDAGEYAQTLFSVVGISLILSWLISMTMTPMNCIAFLKPPEKTDGDGDSSDSGFFRVYRRILEGAIRRRLFTIGAMVALLIGAVVGFTNVPQEFFPDSTRTQFMIDYWAPEGTPIQEVSRNLKPIEEKLLADPRVKSVAAFIGAGGPRFYLPVDPEFPYPSYAQLIVTTQDFPSVVELVDETQPWLDENYPQILTRARKYKVGSGDTWPFELRISGPAEADLNTLRRLGAEAVEILRQEPLAKQARVDMRQRVPKVVLDYDQQRARWSAVNRSDVAEATRRAFDGATIGLYREGDDLLPIIARDNEAGRRRVAGRLDVLQVIPALTLGDRANGAGHAGHPPGVGRSDHYPVQPAPSDRGAGCTGRCDISDLAQRSHRQVRGHGAAAGLQYVLGWRVRHDISRANVPAPRRGSGIRDHDRHYCCVVQCGSSGADYLHDHTVRADWDHGDSVAHAGALRFHGAARRHEPHRTDDQELDRVAR